MSDDLEIAINQAYDPISSDSTRSNAINYLAHMTESVDGWQKYFEKLFNTSNVQVAMVCLNAVGEIILNQWVLFFIYFFYQKI